jgi:hypothetical protein
MMAAESSHVAHGLRCSFGSSNSTGIPRNPAICFHDFSGAALSRSLDVQRQVRHDRARFVRRLVSVDLDWAEPQTF